MDLFAKLSKFQRLDSQRRGKSDPYFKPAIRISIVTSRGAQSEERLITTLKTFGMSAAELFLLDGLDKTPILEAIRPHIFLTTKHAILRALIQRSLVSWYRLVYITKISIKLNS